MNNWGRKAARQRGCAAGNVGALLDDARSRVNGAENNSAGVVKRRPYKFQRKRPHPQPFRLTASATSANIPSTIAYVEGSGIMLMSNTNLFTSLLSKVRM